MKGSQHYYTPPSFIYYSEWSLDLQKEDAAAAQFSKSLKVLGFAEFLTVKNVNKTLKFLHIKFSRLYTAKHP